MKKNYFKYILAILSGLIFLSLIFSSCLVRQIGGAFSHEPEALKSGLSPKAQLLLKQAFEGIPPGLMTDYHTHVLGLNRQKNGTFINPRMQSWLHPLHRLKFAIYTSASGIQHLAQADQEYVSRLVRLIRNINGHGKYQILAFDKFYREDGSVNMERTEFYVPNEYVFQLADRYPDAFEPTISIHPYRPDALEELEKWAKRGAKFIKWLPNGMGIDPSHQKNHRFYQKMKEHQLILLTHTGEEQAVEAEEYQHLGNPLLLRKPLSYGIRVIMAHSASLGKCRDLESPISSMLPCFDLFLRMMGEKDYEGLLFGEISATTQYNRPARVLQTLLQRQEWHHRLINGSDYPLPAVNFVVRTKGWVEQGFLTSEEGRQLNEIYNYNPLLYDFVLKRTLKAPGTDQQFPPSLFLKNPGLE